MPLAPALGKEVQGVAPEALEALRHYPWPGNVRELQSALKQAILQATGPVLAPEFLPADVRAGPRAARGPARDWQPDLSELTRYIQDRLRSGSAGLHAEFHALTERHLLLEVLRHTEGNQSQAAKLLGINRGTLRSKLASLGITIEYSTAVEEATA
jgi:two-component system nitrogen regulation response regulator GlnG